MANPNRQQQPHIKRTQQYVLNDSFDEEFKVLAVENLEFDGAALNRKISATLATRLDDSADPILYIGKAPVGSSIYDPVWQIAKLDTSSGLIKTWADSAGFTQVWDDRASLTYN